MNNFKFKTAVILIMIATSVPAFSQFNPFKNPIDKIKQDVSMNIRNKYRLPNPVPLGMSQGPITLPKVQPLEGLPGTKKAAEEYQKLLDQYKETLKKGQIARELILESTKTIMCQRFCILANDNFDIGRADLGVVYTRMAISSKRPEDMDFRKQDLPFCAQYREALLSSALYFIQINEVDSTQHYLRMAVMIPGDEMEQNQIHAMISQLAFEKGSYLECLLEYAEGDRTMLSPTHGLGVAYSYAAMGDFQNAVATTMKFSYLYPDSVCNYFDPFVDFAHDDYLYVQLIDSVAESLLSYTGSRPPLEMLPLGVIRMYNNGRIEDALRLYSPVSYENGTGWYFLMHIDAGDCYGKSGDSKQALECLDRAVALYDNTFDEDSILMNAQLLIRGVTYFDMNSFEEAYNSLQHVPFDLVGSDYYELMFAINYLYEDHLVALHYLNQYFDSTYSEDLLFKGVCLLNAGNKEGETYLRRVIELEEDGVYKENTPWAYFLLGENRKALKVMECNISSSTLTSTNYFDAADLYLNLGKIRKAKNCLKKAASLNPDKSEIDFERVLFSSTKLERYYNKLFQNDKSM